MSDAAAKVRDGDVYAAYVIYGQVEADFKGHAFSKQAKEAAKALTKDKAHKTEIKAGEKHNVLFMPGRDRLVAPMMTPCAMQSPTTACTFFSSTGSLD